MISASEARRKSIEIHGQLTRARIERQKITVIESVRSAICWGQTYVWEQGQLRKDVVDLLEGEGYTVAQYKTDTMGAYYEIIW